MRDKKSDLRFRILVPAGLIGIHWVLFGTALIWRGDTNSLHWWYESLLLQILLIADLPAMLILSAIGIEFNNSFTDNSFWVFSLAVLAISLQWLLIGVVFGVSASASWRR